MAFTQEQEKKLLVGLLAVLAVLVVYRVLTAEKPRTAPLAFPRGSVATSPVRTGALAVRAAEVDPITFLLSRREERYPGVGRDLFRMENPAPKPKPAPPPPMAVEPPPAPVKTPEEIAADAARMDLSKFRFLGYLTDRESSLFLSKDDELFIVKSGDTVLRTYKVKETGKDYVVLLDTVTNVEVRVELSGSTDQGSQQTQQQQAPWQTRQPPPSPMPNPMPRAPRPPG